VCSTCEIGVQPPLSIVHRHSLSVCVWIQLHVYIFTLFVKKRRRQEPNQSGAWNRRNSLGAIQNSHLLESDWSARRSLALRWRTRGRRNSNFGSHRRKLRRERSPISRHNDRFRLPRACTRIYVPPRGPGNLVVYFNELILFTDPQNKILFCQSLTSKVKTKRAPLLQHNRTHTEMFFQIIGFLLILSLWFEMGQLLLLSIYMIT
jgi:hypothetical protein